MKTEREFIDSVYSKYEQEKARRTALAKRNKTVYLCASLAACFCVVILGAVRVFPALMGANSAMEADNAYVATVRSETYAVTNGSGIIEYSVEDSKNKAYQYAAEEEMFDVCVEEAVEEAADEEPKATRPETTEDTHNAVAEKQDSDLNSAEKAIVSVVDCALIKNSSGEIEILLKGKTVGVIYSPKSRYDDSFAYASDAGAFEDGDEVYVIECAAGDDCVIVLSSKYFTDDQIKKIEASVKK